MPLLASEFDQSRFLRAADLGQIGSEKRLKIKSVTRETVGEKQEVKACMWFTTTEKGLILNKTNLRTLQGAFGNVMDEWAGKIVAVFSMMADFRGQMVPALRVRIPPPKNGSVAPPPPPPPAEDDEVLDDWDAPEQLDESYPEVR